MLRFRLRQSERTPFEKPVGLSDALHRLLIGRGISSAEEAERFLHPSPAQLRDPMLLHDMPRAVERIRRALKERERICIYGDYDVDGVSACTILKSYFDTLNADVQVRIPSRHTEGYGMHSHAMRELAEKGVTLIITVDCGVTNVEQIALAKSLGVDCVVTDHHRPGDTLPDCPVVDPLLGDYPFGFLCGGAMAFKLVAALDGYDEAMKYIDIAALATVADLVPLQDENRVIVSLGLKQMNRNPRPGIAALCEVAGLDASRMIRSDTIAFQIGPRLNAGGRLGSALRSLNLLLAPNAEIAAPLADELQSANEERKKLESDILTDCERMMADFDFSRDRVIVLAGERWNRGVIGLAASRLVEKYAFPTILLAIDGEEMTGSCRSIDGVDIHRALTAVQHFFIRFGGHKQAAGLTMHTQDLDAFRDELNTRLRENTSPALYTPSLEYDMALRLDEATPELIGELEALQPFGLGNPSPVFRTCASIPETRTMGKEGVHLKLFLAAEGARREAVYWHRGFMKDSIPKHADAVFSLRLNEYMGRRTVQLQLSGLQSANPLNEFATKKTQQAELLHEYLTQPLYNREINFSSISEEELMAQLLATPRGTLVICTDCTVAEALLHRFSEYKAQIVDAPDVPMPDILFGQTDARIGLYNTIAVCPTGTLPSGYSRIVIVGCPVLPVLPEGAQILSLPRTPGWLDQLPDVNALREVFVTARALDGQMLYGIGTALDRLGERLPKDRISTALALCVLIHMQLIERRNDARGELLGLHAPKGRKGDPNGDALYTLLKQARAREALI